jgi:hypothetical protein
VVVLRGAAAQGGRARRRGARPALTPGRLPQLAAASATAAVQGFLSPHLTSPAAPPPPQQDNIRDSNTHLRSYNLRDFAELVFKNCPELKKHVVGGHGGQRFVWEPEREQRFEGGEGVRGAAEPAAARAAHADPDPDAPVPGAP